MLYLVRYPSEDLNAKLWANGYQGYNYRYNISVLGSVLHAYYHTLFCIIPLLPLLNLRNS